MLENVQMNWTFPLCMHSGFPTEKVEQTIVCVCPISKDIGINEGKEICLSNKESISGS